MPTHAELQQQDCAHQVDALPASQVTALLAAFDGWQQDGQRIVRSFAFKDYHATLAFIDAIAPMIHAQDHHPELVVTYNKCIVKYDTHSVNGGRGGLSINDFICAAKVDAVFAQAAS